MDGGAWFGESDKKPKRKPNGYSKFVKHCSKTEGGKTRSGADMMRYCGREWRKLTAEQKGEWLRK